MGSKAQQKAAGLMFLFSVFVLVEGMIRLVGQIGAGAGNQWTNDENAIPPFFSPGVAIVAAVIEVVFGVVGCGVAMASLVYGFNNAMLTAVAIGTQFCGWYTFIVFVFAIPAWRADKADYSLMGPYFSDNQSDGLTVLGILGSWAYCAVVQGGQVFFTFELLAVQKGESENRDAGFYKGRHIYYSFMLLMYGVVSIAAGAMVRDIAGEGVINPPVITPPYFMTYPELTITVGVYTTVVGLWAVVRGLAGMHGSSGVAFGLPLGLSFILHLALANLTQIGIILSNGPGPAPAAAALTVLALALHIMPAYLDRQCEKEGDD